MPAPCSRKTSGSAGQCKWRQSAAAGPTVDPQPFPGERPAAPELQPADAGRAVWRLSSTPSAAIASPDPRWERVGASCSAARGQGVRRLGERALRSRRRAGGRHPQPDARSPPGDCDSGQRLGGAGDSYCPGLAAFRGGEGAGRRLQKRGGGVRSGGAGERTPAGWGPISRAPSPGAAVCARRAGGGTAPGLPKPKAILCAELVTRWADASSSDNIPAASPPRSLFHLGSAPTHPMPAPKVQREGFGLPFKPQPRPNLCSALPRGPPITPPVHPRPARAQGCGRPRHSRAARPARTFTSRSCGRRPILGLARSPSWKPGSLGHPRRAGGGCGLRHAG